MELVLAELPESLRHYTGKPVPKWMRVLHPTAAASLLQLEKDTGGLSYTDIWRSAEVSLNARATKQGVQPPGFSGHNFGFSIDLDIDGTLKLRKWTYAQLLVVMEKAGWYCHRRDGVMGKSECWHFNFFGPTPAPYLLVIDPKKASTWSAGVEKRIVTEYGKELTLSSMQVQTALKTMKLYNGDIDGKFGPISRSALGVFQKGWGLVASGDPSDPRTQRTLAFVTATKKIVPVP
jgi:hypothetical protein